MDVVPARIGKHATFTVRTLAGALPGTGQAYTEIDRITLQRIVGPSGIRH